MLVCPSCRSENSEEASVCRVCGRSLEPLAVTLRRSDEARDREPEIDLPPPTPRSPWPAIVVGLVVALALSGWGVWAATRPNPCEGKYSSALFAYCADIPPGWSGGSQLAGEENRDEFARRDGDAATFVRVEQVIDPTVQTQQYVQQFRTSQQAEGLEPGQVEVVELDGEQALAWNYSVPTEEGEAPLRLREVVLVRTDGAWRITLVATDQAYAEARLAFEELLFSWRWKT